MTLAAIKWAYSRDELAPAPKAVLVCLAFHADFDNRCWPSSATIVRECSLGRSTAFRALDLLVKQRLIEKTEVRGRPTEYLLMATSPAAGLDDQTDSADPSRSGTSDPLTRPAAGLDPSRSGTRTLKGKKEERVPPIVPQEGDVSDLFGRPAPPAVKVNGKHANGHAAAGSAFDDFWAIYWRKEGKGAARRAFEKALKGGVQAQTIVAAAAAQAASYLAKEPRFRPHPATWLNEGRWDDEVAPVAPLQRFVLDRGKV